MLQTLAFVNKRMRVAFTKAGNDVWIVYHRVHTGQDTRDNPEYTERGYLYSSAEGPGRLTNRNIDFITFVEELNINGVKDYQWRTHAYVLWKVDFGEARWRYEGDGDVREGGDGGDGGGNDDQNDGDADGDVAERLHVPILTHEMRRATCLEFLEICRKHDARIKAIWPRIREMGYRPA